MKKAEQVSARKNIAVAKKRYNNTLRRKTKKYGCYKSEEHKFLNGYTTIKAPESVSIYANNKHDVVNLTETLEFKNKLESTIPESAVLIDFSTTKRITAAAMVTLYASVDALISQSSYDIRIRWSRVSYAVNKILKRCGFFNLVRRKNGLDIVDYTDIKHLPIISGIGNQNVDNIIDYIASRYSEEMDSETEHLYGDAVTETVNNVGRHAYPEINPPERKWWIMCEVINHQVYLAIYDSGVGIPNTVVHHKWYLGTVKKMYPEQYKEAISTPSNQNKFIPLLRLPDHDLINLSMLGDVSATRLDKHGQGSKSIKALVNETDGGKLWIFSRKGLLIYESSSTPVTLISLPKAIPGTLIQWNIKLS
ncbi:hypothetical protein [Shewanella sp. Isolate11]|uniref:hypothetical protein n=1 Tax=Shewanella sp. Isolate11 TaxID=2908530 RepID=UPI001EFD5C16|nr:hypothetical protein [Shewanella sp. Isolate11]MCG9697438.1 hypothetical protein [Shewanella sp. Isolate11]